MGCKGAQERGYRGENIWLKWHFPELTHEQIYLYRLMIEYARIIDDNRDRIGYSGDGSELDKYDAKKLVSLSNGGINAGHNGKGEH